MIRSAVRGSKPSSSIALYERTMSLIDHTFYSKYLCVGVGVSGGVGECGCGQSSRAL